MNYLSNPNVLWPAIGILCFIAVGLGMALNGANDRNDANQKATADLRSENEVLKSDNNSLLRSLAILADDSKRLKDIYDGRSQSGVGRIFWLPTKEKSSGEHDNHGWYLLVDASGETAWRRCTRFQDQQMQKTAANNLGDIAGLKNVGLNSQP